MIRWKKNWSVAERDVSNLRKWEKQKITTQECFKAIAYRNAWSNVSINEFIDEIYSLGWERGFKQDNYISEQEDESTPMDN